MDSVFAAAVASHGTLRRAMEKSLEVVRRQRDAGTIYDERQDVTFRSGRAGSAGYWGMLIDPRYGGQGAPFARFSRFLTKMATIDPMVAGLASVHGCIGAVDPVRTFGTPEQKERFLPRLASGEALSGFALTEPGAGSDLTALRTTAVLDGDDYVVNGEKLFITNAIPGRTIGLVVPDRRQAGRADRRSAGGGGRAFPDRPVRPVRPAARATTTACASTTSACRRKTCSCRHWATA